MNKKARRFEGIGVYNLAIAEYERAMLFGELSNMDYARLAVLYRKNGNIAGYNRVIRRLKELHLYMSGTHS